MVNRALVEMHELEIKSGSESCDDLDDDCDGDVCEEITKIFTVCPQICQKTVAPDKYILQIAATLDHNPNIAAALSDHTCEIFNLSNQQLAEIATLSEHTEPIVEVKFGIDCNLVYTASNDGSVRLWDLRTPKTSKLKFTDTDQTDNLKKSFTSFDISPNNRLLAAGTNLFEGDAYILFWDLRKSSFVGGYWESHTDDITQVKFHPEDSNQLISGSVDGLINVYDLLQTDEDSALVDTLNTESSIEKLQWHDDNIISCITHTAEVQLWKIEGAEPYAHLHRSELAKGMMRKSEDFVYVVDVHKNSNQLFVLAGSNYQNGECFRGVLFDKKSTKPAFVFPENSQRVRTSWFNHHHNLLLTGGEKGILDIWTVQRL